MEFSACVPFMEVVEPLLGLRGIFAAGKAGNQLAVSLFRVAGLFQLLFTLRNLIQGRRAHSGRRSYNV